ncbi:sensor histidine kinase [Mycobacterium sp. BMJ-28]
MSGFSAPMPSVGGEAHRIRMYMGRFIGGGYLAYFVAAIAEIRAEAAIVAPWWTPLALVAAFGPGWVLFAVSFVPRLSALLGGFVAAACGGGYLMALGLWFVAWNGGEVEGQRGTWLVLFPGLASLAVVLVRRPWLAIAHLGVSAPVAQLANALGRSDRYGHGVLLGDLAWAVLFSAVFVLAGIMAVRTGDVLDATRERVADLAGRAAAQQARAAEQAWYDRLIHDRVLMVLQQIRAGVAQPHLVAYAEQAMRELDADSPAARALDGDLAPLLRTVLAAIAPGITVQVSDVEESALDLSPEVTRELVDAAAEAVRNAVRHGSNEVGVRVDIDAAQVRVHIVDDGPGFDLATVGTDRMGLAHSIIARMAEVGGRATVQSEIGHGTQVVLAWPT